MTSGLKMSDIGVQPWTSQKRSPEGFVIAGTFGDCHGKRHDSCPRYMGRFECKCVCHHSDKQRPFLGGHCFEGKHDNCPVDTKALLCTCGCHSGNGAHRPSPAVLAAGGTETPPKLVLKKRRKKR